MFEMHAIRMFYARRLCKAEEDMIKEELLEIMEKNARIPMETLSIMLNKDEDSINKELKAMEADKTIAGYHTMINWDKTNQERVTALIEVKVIPQRDEGFDKIARRIYEFEEVASVFLMSGPFDLMVIVEGRTMQEVARFVRERLAIQETVTSTATYFILKKYKENGIFMEETKKDERELVTP